MIPLIKPIGGEAVREFTIIPAVAAKPPENAVNKLVKNPNVKYVE